MVLDALSQSIPIPAYAVVEPQADGRFSATVLGWTEVRAQGDSRQEALAKLEQLMKQRLDQADIVPLALTISESAESHPWAKFAGIFAEDEQFLEVLDEITSYRQALNESSEDTLA